MPIDLHNAFGWDNSTRYKGDPQIQMPWDHQYGLVGRKFDYWLYPDGTNCAYKTFVTTKTGFFLGLPIAIFNWTNMGNAKAMVDFVKPFPKRILPLTAAGFIFGSSACYSAALRGKDDIWNYTFAGAAGGTVMAATMNPGKFHGGAIVFFAFAATLYKYSKLLGLRWLPGYRKMWMSGDFDGCSMMPDHSVGKEYGPLTGYEEWNIPSEKSGQW